MPKRCWWQRDYIVKRPLESPRPVRVPCTHYVLLPGYENSEPQFDLRGASTPESVRREIEKDHSYEWLRHL